MLMVKSVVGGVDTHADAHVAAALDSNGGVLGVESFPADGADRSRYALPDLISSSVGHGSMA